MEAKTIFREKDKVYVASVGWGTVIDAGCSTPDGWVGIESNGRIFSIETYFVSFTKYTLEGFSQERPEELPDVGQVVWVRKIFPSEWIIGHFREKKKDRYYISSCNNEYNDFGFEIRTTNPYANEPTKEDEKAMVGN